MSSGDRLADIENEDPSAENLTQTNSGDLIDMNNLPGKKRLTLVAEGELAVEQFVSPANMPGKKLKEMRDRFAETFKSQVDRAGGVPIDEYKPGSLFEYKDGVYEVLAVDPVKGLKIAREYDGKLKNVWVNPSKGKRVTDDRTGDD